MQDFPQTRNKAADITQNYYHRPPVTWLSFEKICSYFPTNWHKMASKDTPYLCGLQQRHWDKERGKKKVPSPSVIRIKILRVTAKEERLSHYRKKIHLFCKITCLGWLPKTSYLAEHKQSCLQRCYMAKPYMQSLLIIFLKPFQGPL